jgi:tetratricopeptide (TPR) repeat protein
MLSWGILVYLISITAVSNYLMPVAGMLADRFLLLPSLGWIIVFIFLLQKIAKLDTDTKPTWAAIKSPVKYVFTGLLLVYSVVTFARNMDWKDSLTLFRKDVKYVDNSSQAHNLLALRLMKISYEPSTPASDQLPMRQEAAQHFRRAIEIYPPFFNANFDLGRTYVILNQPDSAIVAFKKALLIDPNFTPAVITVGELYMQQNNLTEAEAYFKEAVRLKPTEYQSYNKLLGIYYFQKNYSAAISIAKLAVEKIPGQPEAYISLGRIYQDLKQNDSTRLWLNKALEVSPQNQEALRLLQAIGH